MDPVAWPGIRKGETLNRIYGCPGRRRWDAVVDPHHRWCALPHPHRRPCPIGQEEERHADVSLRRWRTCPPSP